MTKHVLCFSWNFYSITEINWSILYLIYLIPFLSPKSHNLIIWLAQLCYNMTYNLCVILKYKCIDIIVTGGNTSSGDEWLGRKNKYRWITGGRVGLSEEVCKLISQLLLLLLLLLVNQIERVVGYRRTML